MRQLITIAFIVKLGLVFGQSNDLFSYPEIIREGLTITDFVPDKWTILDSTYGDLNGDKTMDIAIVLQSEDSLKTIGFTEFSGELRVNQHWMINYKRRILLILFKDSLTNKYSLIEQNKTIISCQQESTLEDPFKKIKIENGYLDMRHIVQVPFGNSYQYFFKYRNGEFILERVYENKENFNMRDTHNFDYEAKSWSKIRYDFNTGKIYNEQPSGERNEKNIKTIKDF
jgi:hypothetical protein